MRKTLKEDAVPANNMGSGAIADPKNRLLGGRKIDRNELLKRWISK